MTAMSRAAIPLILLLAIALAAAAAVDTYYTRQPENWLREGPGAYYPLVAVLPAGEEIVNLAGSDKWMQVRSPEDVTGWMAASSVVDATGGRPQARRESVRAEAGASVERFLAAIRNFARQYARARSLFSEAAENEEAFSAVVESLLAAAASGITREDVAAFAELLPVRGTDPATPLQPYEPGLGELQAGIALAARVAQQPLLEDEGIENYVRLILAHLLEHTPFYATPFSLLILDDPVHDGFACPGGFLFLTKGAIISAQDEAELAALIAHEIAHVVHRHGARELGEREDRLRAADAFDELEREVDVLYPDDADGYAAVTAELEADMEAAYEAVVHERLIEYEVEADETAARLLFAAGYDPFGLVRMVSRQVASFDERLSLATQDARLRAERSRTFVSRLVGTSEPGRRLQERFTARIRSLE